jgi:predicted RNase H-like HicB family nuclease/predicted RNA binding protein YcfA (HicA-like mRNA interferase family)
MTRYTVLIEPEEGGGFHAFVPALHGCHSQGDSKEEARSNIQEAAEVYLQSLKAEGQPVPSDTMRTETEPPGRGVRAHRVATPRLPVVSVWQLIRVAEQSQGFRLHRRKGNHALYYRESDEARIVIPLHAGKSVKPKTLSAIVSDMRLTVDEFRSLL